MKTVLWVTGEPGSGKSCLANKLHRDYSFSCPLSVDSVYVRFVKETCPALYFKALHKYIAPHYERILSTDHSKKHFYGRDFVKEWRCYLYEQIEKKATDNEKVVVEGYLLKYREDLRKKLERQLPEQVFDILARDCKYTHKDEPKTVGEIARLGSDPAPEA